MLPFSTVLFRLGPVIRAVALAMVYAFFVEAFSPRPRPPSLVAWRWFSLTFFPLPYWQTPFLFFFLDVPSLLHCLAVQRYVSGFLGAASSTRGLPRGTGFP